MLLYYLDEKGHEHFESSAINEKLVNRLTIELEKFKICEGEVEMSKQKQEAISDLASKKSLTLPLTVATRSNRVVDDGIEVPRHTDLYYRNRDGHLMKESEEVKDGFRGAQLALSKVVDKAFTGWTVKTQKQE